MASSCACLLPILLLIIASLVVSVDPSPSELLSLGDDALATDDVEAAMEYYEKGVASMATGESLVVALSLYTNLGTARSSVGDEEAAAGAYRKAILRHGAEIEAITDKETKRDASNIAAQSAFFLGMTHQNLGNPKKAADAYSFANSLDPLHWASLANLGSVLQDDLKEPAEALAVYNKAYDILMQKSEVPTDAPEDPRGVLSQIQYRIGLSLTADPDRKCAMQDDPTKEVPCEEMAANAFSLAIRFDESNESAKHMLAAITADGSMRRASSTYVKDLFENYAPNFENSLVNELGYNGFQRLRLGFDRAFGGSEKIPSFPLVIDAGCGTGLTGKQFRNISSHLIGVDLSPAIIEEAKKARPGLYDELEAGDITEVFRQRKPISLIVAGDSFIYFGDLMSLFDSIQEGLGDGGFVAFTLENASEESEKSLHETKPDWRWQLTPSGRFAHRKEYVETVGVQHSLKLMHYEPLDDFRLENGVGVRGHMFVMRKEQDKEL